MINNIIYINIY